jgi:hypothetical protein
MTLRDYQADIAVRGLKILKTHGLLYLCMAVRTGKSLTSLHIAHRATNGGCILFVTKKKAIGGIEADIAASGLKFDQVTVTNYEQVKKLYPENYDLIIADEAHQMKAFPKPSGRTMEMQRVCWYKPIIYLSGTAAPESYSELYHQFWISCRSPYHRYNKFYDWARDYVKIKEVKRGNFMVNDYSDADGPRILRELSPIMISFSQEEAGFRCEVKEYFHIIEIPRLGEMIKALDRDKIINIQENPVVADNPAKLLTKLHQLCGGTIITENGPLVFSTAKAEFIKEHFKGRRIAIFYKFIAEREILESTFPHHTTDPVAFEAGKSDVFLSQIISGREGITLSTADAIVMYSICFSAVSYWHARARLQTLARTTPAEVHWIFAMGGIEKKIYRAVSNKKDFTLSFYRRCRDE